jgi:hypothetical protein
MRELLLPKRNEEHKLYERLRDEYPNTHIVNRRKFFNELWNEYEPFAPQDFPNKLQREFHQRWWEMYLFVSLRHLDITPSCFSVDDGEGPDIAIDIGGQKVFIEAVAPTVGTKSDKVPDPIEDGVADFPERECLLRLTQALTYKRDIICKYMKKGVITTDACIIIALSASDLNQFGTLLDGVHPALLSVLAGAGPLVVTSGGQKPPYSSRRSDVKRDSGNPVNTALFEKPEFSIISGVLYSPDDLWNAELQPENNLSLFVNPSAVKKIPNDLQQRFVSWTQKTSTSNETVWGKTQPSIVPDN